ncbi:MAG: hypothetical protein NTX22_00355 [Ignavibacteriales bacterium]|nr:hypothetical protein [Ignavibacteriales bacterium]
MNKFLLFTFLFVSTVFFFSCKEKVTDSVFGNKAPDTFISLFPDQDISKQQSKLRVRWWGDDPDGLIVGYYFTWDNVHWSFTKSNDSTFALQIGASDTNYTFKVASVDNSGNGVYDQEVNQNGINFGPEPFIDKNGNGTYDAGETFFDVGTIDPVPAQLKFPIKNSAPQITWSSLTVLPDTSFPVMTFGWDAEDIDGNETITRINVAVNDTNKSLSLPGSTRLILIRVKDFSNNDAQAEVLINGSESHVVAEKLTGIKLNGNNTIYIQAEDISGAKSKFISLPQEPKNWYVKKPSGKMLVIDDYQTVDNSPSFYRVMFDSLNNGSLKSKYDVWDIFKNKVPYESVTFLETVKMFKYIFWYTDNNPSLSLTSVSVRKFMDAGGKIAFSMIFPQTIEQQDLQNFLPIDSAGTSNGKSFTNSLFPNTNVLVSEAILNYPPLKTNTTIFRVRTFYPIPSSAIPVYNVESTQITLNKTIGFRSLDKKLFFIGLPLSKTNAIQTNVKTLLEKVFFEDFGLTP